MMRLSPSSVFADTSYYYACLDSRDRHHARTRELNLLISQQGLALVSSWEIVVETVTLLRNRHSFSAATIFIRHLLPHIEVIYLDEKSRARAIHLFEKFSRDKRLSLCDVISYLLVTEHLKGIPCLAFDDDFRQLGLNVMK
ncbi:MAG: type II toxin-antitoxin system VapC family toxin [Deltaproteobacteria bacterium]|nr:type II toxin-antitoxin system VapC family toxin [Deltaproteobacteria bacterium]